MLGAIGSGQCGRGDSLGRCLQAPMMTASSSFGSCLSVDRALDNRNLQKTLKVLPCYLACPSTSCRPSNLCVVVLLTRISQQPVDGLQNVRSPPCHLHT